MEKIIKKDAASSLAGIPGGRRIDAEVYRATHQAERVLAEARAEAERTIEGARSEVERLRAEAAEAGRQEGLAQAAGAIARAALERDRLLAATEKELVQLALAVAEKVIGRELEQRPAGVVEIAARALAEARQRREISLRVHPDDAATIRAQERRLVDLLSRARQIQIREDESVCRGGVLVETEAGVIDARLETQLAVLQRVLEEAGS